MPPQIFGAYSQCRPQQLRGLMQDLGAEPRLLRHRAQSTVL